MAEDCVGNSVATTSTTSLNQWYLHAANSVSSWNNNNRTDNAWNNQGNPNSSSSCEEDISVSTSSFTNASNHSSLTVESSRRLVDPPASSSIELMGEHGSDNHLWSHVLSGVGSNVELHNGQEIGENFLEALSSKNMASSMFEPACDYLKKLDHTSWEYNGGGSTSFNGFQNKHLNDNNNYNNGFSEAMINENNERLTKLSNLVSTWSIAPPDPEVSSHHHHHHHGHHYDHRHHHPPTNNMSLGSSIEHHDQYPQCFGDSTSSCPIEGGGSTNSNSGVLFPSCYDHHQDMKVKQEFQQASDVQGAILEKPFIISTTSGYHQNNGLLANNNSVSLVGESGKIYHGLPNLSSSCTRNNISDVISFNSRLGRPITGIHAQKPNLKHFNLSESKKQGLHQTPSPIRTNNGRGEGTTAREVKKKISEESSESILKKPKQDTSTASSTKVQAPKIKIGDKITALQQIVSPFGKTDTASVLFEAIGYIKFLQEQVQLLSNPYLKSNSHKDPWGSLDRKLDNEDGKLELRSRGLCLVPTSCTPLVYRDNSGPDYWTPAYRGCLYR